MGNLIQNNFRWNTRPFSESFFEGSLHSALFLVLFELAAGFSYYLMEISLIILLLSFSCFLYVRYHLHPIRIWNVLQGRIGYAGWVAGILILYLAWDCITAIQSPYTNFSDFISKYKVVVLMVFIGVCILFYLDDSRKINRILINIFGAGIFSSLFSLLNYSLLRIYPIYYGKRLSLRLDYNMFASVLMMGLLAGFFLILQCKCDKISKIWQIILLFETIVPVVILSSSRRNYILLLPICAVSLIDFHLACKKQPRDETQKKLIILFPVLILGLVWGTVTLLNVYLNSTYQTLLNTEKGVHLSAGEASAQERYETMEEEKNSSKRGLIWGIAIDEVKGYTKQEFLFGKGFGYDRWMYAHTDNLQLKESYTEEARTKLSAHCFLLADLLNGGIIQGILAISLWFGIGILLILLLRAYPITAQFYVIGFGLIFMNNFISNRYGFLYDKYFWILFVLLIAESYLIKTNQRRITY